MNRFSGTNRSTRLGLGALGLVLALMTLLVPVAERAADAQTSGGGELGPDFVRARASDLGAGTFPGAGLPASQPAIESPFTWTRLPTGNRCVVFAGPVPPELVGAVSPLPSLGAAPFVPLFYGALQGARPGTVQVAGNPTLPAGAVDGGEFVLDAAQRRGDPTGALIVPRCTTGGDALPPAPPDAASIWEQIPLPRGHVHASPPGTREWPGIVNLESRFWGNALPEARATVTLDGYVVDVVAHPVGYGWALSDGTTVVGPTPGSPDAPLRATFRRRGDQSVALFVTWEGSAHVTAPALGLDFGFQNLGTVTLRTGVVHRVAEIRALLRSRTARG